MGVAKELGASDVAGVCKITGYPQDRYGHLLNPISDRTGYPVDKWFVEGTELANLTSPYGFLQYAVGSGDDFHCFDFTEIDAAPNGKFIILHSVINSETGGFIQDGEYLVLPCNTPEEMIAVCNAAKEMNDAAVSWVAEGEGNHDEEGWNQDDEKFVRDVIKHVSGMGA